MNNTNNVTVNDTAVSELKAEIVDLKLRLSDMGRELEKHRAVSRRAYQHLRYCAGLNKTRRVNGETWRNIKSALGAAGYDVEYI